MKVISFGYKNILTQSRHVCRYFCRIFDPKTVETVLSGTHYYTIIDHLIEIGLLMIAEAIEKLKSEAFWANHVPNDYTGAVEKIESIRSKLCELDHDNLVKLFNDNCVAKLLEAVKKFSEDCAKSSEQCQFWEEFLRIMGIIKNFIIKMSTLIKLLWN